MYCGCSLYYPLDRGACFHQCYSFSCNRPINMVPHTINPDVWDKQARNKNVLLYKGIADYVLIMFMYDVKCKYKGKVHSLPIELLSCMFLVLAPLSTWLWEQEIENYSSNNDNNPTCVQVKIRQAISYRCTVVKSCTQQLNKILLTLDLFLN